MTTPTTLNWKSSTPAQRNAACACFMPPSNVNPIRSWHLHVGGDDLGPMAIGSQKEADDFMARIPRLDQQTWEQSSLRKFLAWEKRDLLHVVERRRNVNYSNTPGGAWMLLDRLMAEGYMIAVAARSGLTALSAERYNERQIITPQNAPPVTAFEGSEPFEELAAMLFLTLNGCSIIQ